jgi:arylsulfatase A-like enzyme
MPAADRPNIVYILHDNTGWGDWGVYGGTTATPRIDKFASEGIRFNNYTVEAQCTPTRSAILTGRLPSRSGTFAVPLPGQGAYGVCPWEYTIANLLSDAGYATSQWGKWHLGEVDGRLPHEQGFDECWFEKNTTDEAGYTSYPLFNELIKRVPGMEPPKLWEAKKGEKATPVRDLDMEVRPFLDQLIAEKATDFIQRKARDGVPFFTYIAFTHFHPPEAVHPDFDRKSPARSGLYADIVAEQDYRTGQILDAIEEAGITDNTLVVLASDNSAGGTNIVPGGSNGPWHGNFFTPPYEGSMRVGAMVRWPGKVPAGVVTEEMLTSVDWYRTFATIAGAADRVPTDRPIDSVDASAFLLGKAPSTGRDHVLFAGPDGELMSVKYGDIKVIFRYGDGIDKPIVKPMFPIVYDLGSDPGEQFNLMYEKLDMMFMFAPAFKALGEYQQSIAKYRNIKPGEEFTGYGDVEHPPNGETKAAEYKYQHHQHAL